MASTSDSVMTELIEDEGEPRYKITDIIGKSKYNSSTKLLIFYILVFIIRQKRWTWSRESMRFWYDIWRDFTSI